MLAALKTEQPDIEANGICREAIRNGFAAIEAMYDLYGSRNASLAWIEHSDIIENVHVSALFDDYNRIRAGREQVAWSDFECTRHRHLLGDMNVLELDQASGLMRYRVYGTNVAHRYGKDLTGTILPDKVPSLAALYHGLFLASAASGRAIYGSHHPPRNAKVRDCQRLILPFTDEQGIFSRLLVAHLPAQTKVGTVGSVLSAPW